MEHVEEKNQDGKGFVALRPVHIQAYEALDDFWKTHGFAPLLRELAVSIGSTLRTTQRVIVELETAGYVERASKKAWRNYRPIKHPNVMKN